MFNESEGSYMAKDKEKTNVMRVLESLKIPYHSYNYLDSGVISGAQVAEVLNQNPDMVFKTLVTEGTTKNHYVFLIPVLKELDLKKAAKLVGEKKIEMIKSKDLLPLTGYIHGGCSPIGMKKYFKTYIDESSKNYKQIIFSGGKIGFQVEIMLDDLSKAIRFEYGDLT